jgi:hypothetical protein
MQERMRGLLIIFSAGFLFIIISAVFTGLHNAPIALHTQNISGVITPGGQYSANVTLDLALYQDSIQNIKSASSNVTGDYPSAAYYNPTGRVLEISGLADGSTRALTVQYGVTSDVVNDMPALPAVLITAAWLFIFAGIALLVAGILIIFGRI